MTDAVTFVPEPHIDILPNQQVAPPLSAVTDRPPQPPGESADKAPPPLSEEVRPENAEAKEAAEADKAKAEADAGAKPLEDEAKAPKEDQTPAWMKAEVTKERNRRRAAEERMTALEEQVRQTLALAEKYIPKPGATPEPQKDQFQDPDSYLDARADWLAEQRIAARQADDQRKAQESEMNRIQREHQARLTESEAKYPGIAEVARDPTLPVSEAMGAAIITSDNGPDILHWLDENRDEAKRIAGLTPARAAAEIGKIEATLTAKPTAQVSKTPKPITPVGSNNANKKTAYEQTSEEFWAEVDANRQAKLAAMSQVVLRK